MYFWKFWQDTRRDALVYFIALIFCITLWLANAKPTRKTLDVGRVSPVLMWDIELDLIFAMTSVCAMVLAFMVGSNSVGADIGKGIGDFMLTRPRSRRYFAWAGWAAGALAIFSVLLVTVLLFLAAWWYVAGPSWLQVHSPMRYVGGNGQVHDVWLMLATIVLSTAVFYGLTYFLSIGLGSGHRAVVWSAAIVLGYSIVVWALEVYKHITLPGFNFSELALHPPKHWYLAPATQMIGWTALAIGFPFAAQIALERSDV